MRLTNLFLALVALFAITITSCTDECDGVTCPAGYICDAGTCIVDPLDPCGAIECPDGFICQDGTCVLDGFVTEVQSGTISSNTTWTADKIYELAGKVVVNDGATLTIEAGTIIKGRSGTGSLASALIIARGSKIEAVGTATAPIIFTSTSDNIAPGTLDGENLTNLDNEKWGGLIILGNAPISADISDTEAQIEGIPANETYGLYGGTDAADNSGTLKYVSVRHGGALIGDGNEINGITLGGVGSGTSIDHVEVAANLDDGIEFFGGTVSVTNAIVSWQGDDGIDIDQNYSGTVTNFAVIHGGDDTDEALEIDGPEGSTYTDGKFSLVNGTLIAVDQIVTSGADFKSKAQGSVTGVSWQGYANNIKVRASFDPDNACAEKSDAYSRLVSGDLLLSMNEVVGSISPESVGRVYSDDDPGEEDCFNAVAMDYETALDNNLGLNGNNVVSGASRGADMSEFDNWTLASIRNWY